MLPRVAILHQPLGSDAHLEFLHGEAGDTEDDDASILERARAVELEALLEFGQAIWRPTTYHYRLITGEHAEAYVKLSDAIREPRDAEVMASWLHRFIANDMGFVFDTGTMTPIAQALRLAAATAGCELGPIEMLDNYPRTGVDVDAIVDRVSGDPGLIVAVLSVSSTGTLLERVLGALDRKGSSLTVGRVVVLVDKSGRPSQGVDRWTPLAGQSPLVPPGPMDGSVCRLCRTPGRAQLVPINPFTYDAMFPTQLRQVVPDIRDPMANRALWEAAQRTDALAVERKGNTALRRFRSDKVPMGIVMRVGRLLADEGFRRDVLDHVARCQRAEGMSANSDLVLVPEHEAAEDGFPAFWEVVGPVLAPAADVPVTFPTAGTFDDNLRERIRAATSILVFQLGTVSGATLQRALVGIQSTRYDLTSFELHAFVVHLRPATSREWESIRNSYGHVGRQPQLRYAWKSILPDRSPLREERALLKSSDLGLLNDDAKAFVDARMNLCAGQYVGDRPAVLWGSTPDSVLTPNSIYGQRLDAVSTYVAVGSAMGAALVDPGRTTPEFRVFEMAAMARSYYDPIILGCFLRWIRPHEVFWGWTAREAATTAHHMLDRAEPAHRHILVPEMLLAAAHGKLTRDAALVTVASAAELRARDDIPQDVAAAVDVGRALIGDLDQLGPTDGFHG